MKAAAFRSCCWSLLLLSFTGIAPSSAQSEEEQVQGILGESFAFSAPVFKRGTLLYADLGTLAIVTGGTGDTEMTEKFKDRLHWDRQTGLFTITELKLQDEGQYKVDNSDGHKILTTFQLRVYKRVSKPTVDAHNCSFLCSVENDRDVTLSWTRGKDVLKRTSSPHLNATLSLHLDVLGHPETYYCEVRNPVSSERLPVDSEEGCSPSPGNGGSSSSSSRLHVIVGFVIGGALLALGIAAVCFRKLRRRAKDSSTSAGGNERIEYAEVFHPQQRNIPELGGSSPSHAMTTVYDQLRLPFVDGSGTSDY